MPRYRNKETDVIGLILIGVLASCSTSAKKPSPHAQNQSKSAKVQTASMLGMVQVPAGEFLMGCNAKVDTDCAEKNSGAPPAKKVFVDTFRIDRTEVTVKAYAACVKDGACTQPNGYSDKPKSNDKYCNWGAKGRDQHPINCIDWRQASNFCKWKKLRLPTGAEWEKAARGTDGRTYPWGNNGYDATPVANIADKSRVWSGPYKKTPIAYDDGYDGTAPVGSFPAGKSPYGADDMIGNVAEWTSDKPPHGGGNRMARGGSWIYGPKANKAASNTQFGSYIRSPYFGFRCASSSPKEP